MPATNENPDWILIREEYINGTKSYRQLAAAHGVTESLLEKRGVIGKWSVLRREASAKVAREVANRLMSTRIMQLEKWNAADIKLAGSIRAQVTRHLTLMQRKKTGTLGDWSISKLASLALTAARAQHIGRLALGASTENIEQPALPGQAPSLNDFHDMVDLMGPAALPGIDAGAPSTH